MNTVLDKTHNFEISVGEIIALTNILYTVPGHSSFENFYRQLTNLVGFPTDELFTDLEKGCNYFDIEDAAIQHHMKYMETAAMKERIAELRKQIEELEKSL